nr:ATP-binding protein [uncultured Treponema sp.]
MKIVTKQAANLFFPNTSLEYVYYEAIANAIDAGATDIDIAITIDKFSEHKTLKITIIDNGEGFTDKNFEKFCNVLSADDKQHKGIGRLVFLNFFSKIEIESIFNQRCRQFTFDDDFDGECNLVKTSDTINKTKLVFSEYRKEKIYKHDFICPEPLKKNIIYHFLPQLYKLKLKNSELKITISLEIQNDDQNFEFENSSTIFDLKELPTLKEKSMNDTRELFDKFKILYSIEKTYTDNIIISAICADERTIPIEIITDKNYLANYKMIFLLYSTQFDGKTNMARDKMDINESDYKYIQRTFINMVAQIIEEELPNIKEYNIQTSDNIKTTYPHLYSYVDKKAIGLVDKNKLLADAQTSFFNDQKEILEADSLDNEQYEKSLDLSSKVLVEYILYRAKIIKKLQAIKKDNSEADIHNLIVPMKRTYSGNDKAITDFFHNNAWILDDRYMSYTKILSDKDIETIYKDTNIEGTHIYSDKETGRPDLTIIFSNDPNTTKTFDVVIIEFKKLGLPIGQKRNILDQLRERARRLIQYYPKKIQRIWFYGIIDFDIEFEASLKEDSFKKVFSLGDMYHKLQSIIPNPHKDEKVEVDVFILSYNTMLNDAEARNNTFLELLKKSINSSEDDTISEHED